MIYRPCIFIEKQNTETKKFNNDDAHLLKHTDMWICILSHNIIQTQHQCVIACKDKKMSTSFPGP